MAVANRVKEAQVAAILAPGGDWDGTTPITPFIGIANKVVTKWIEAVATYRSKTVATDEAVEMEKLLAAWAFKMSDQQYKSKNSGRSSATFRGQDGTGIDSNTYGTAAAAFDALLGYNVLRPMVEGRIAGFDWLGLVPSAQTPYDQRD